MHKLTLAAFALLMLAPASQACSLLYDEFDAADLHGDKVVTNIGQDAVVIDLATGKPATVGHDFFPVFRFAGSQPYVLLSGQKGLEADCSGVAYFKVLRTTGSQVHDQGRVVAFDADGTQVVWINPSGTYLTTIGSWTTAKRIASGQGADGYPSIALDAASGRIAISHDDGAITLHDLTGKQTARYDLFGDAAWASAMDWHDGQLVVARAGDDMARFWVLDVDTGAYRVFTLQGAFDEPTIATGAMLLLHYGDTVLRVDDDGSDKLRLPSGYMVGSVAGDDQGAVVLLRKSQSDGWDTGAGILRIQGDGRIGDWYAKASDGDWDKTTRPAFAWQDGPAPVLSQGPTTEDAAAAGFVFVLAAIAYALGRRTG